MDDAAGCRRSGDAAAGSGVTSRFAELSGSRNGVDSEPADPFPRPLDSPWGDLSAAHAAHLAHRARALRKPLDGRAHDRLRRDQACRCGHRRHQSQQHHLVDCQAQPVRQPRGGGSADAPRTDRCNSGDITTRRPGRDEALAEVEGICPAAAGAARAAVFSLPLLSAARLPRWVARVRLPFPAGLLVSLSGGREGARAGDGHAIAGTDARAGGAPGIRIRDPTPWARRSTPL